MPTAPTDLAAETIGATVRLHWTRPSDGDPVGYQLEAGTVPGARDIGAWTLPPSPSYDVAGVPDGRYFVRVWAGTGAGISPPSNEVEVVVGTPPPLAPTGLVATVDGGTVSLTWSAVAGEVTGYELDVGSSSGTADLVRGAPLGLATTSRFESVPLGSYCVRVRALNRTGSSPPSNEVWVAIPAGSTPR